MAEGQILQVAVFAVIFGIALATLSEEKRGPVLRLTESLSEVMFRFTNVVMYFAPVGVGAAMAYTVGHMGLGVLVNLGKLLLTLYGALVAFGLLVMLPAALLFRCAGAAVCAGGGGAGDDCVCDVDERGGAAAGDGGDGGAGSAAAGGELCDSGGVQLQPGWVNAIPGGGVDLCGAGGGESRCLGVEEQLLMMGTLLLTSKGVAGVPRATLVVLLATAATFKLPTEPIFVILGVDALMDMARTTVNVVGNCLASAVVARWEGVFGEEAVDIVVAEGVGL